MLWQRVHTNCNETTLRFTNGILCQNYGMYVVYYVVSMKTGLCAHSRVATGMYSRTAARVAQQSNLCRVHPQAALLYG
jgi:hypothetical protein